MKKPGILARCADGGICTRDPYCVIAALPRRHEKAPSRKMMLLFWFYSSIFSLGQIPRKPPITARPSIIFPLSR